mgnify:CR=1 FL=1
MAITDTQKVDLLWKKIGFNKAKTDSNASKKAPNEAVVSDFIIKPSSIWSDVSNISATKPIISLAYFTSLAITYLLR